MTNKINILAYGLDDNESTLKLIEESLKIAHVKNYKLFSTLDELLKKWSNKVNLCIVDYYVPPFQGEEIIHAIKDKNKFCYIIMISSITDVIKITDLFHSGLNRFVSKSDDLFIEKLAQSITSGVTWLNELCTILDESKEAWTKLDDLLTKI